jgi:hypothetical protein
VYANTPETIANTPETIANTLLSHFQSTVSPLLSSNSSNKDDLSPSTAHDLPFNRFELMNVPSDSLNCFRLTVGFFFETGCVCKAT